MFQNGNALFERNWPYAWSLHNADDSLVKGKVGIARIPHFPGKKSASTLGGWHIVVSKFSDRKETAVKFLKYIISYELQKKLSLKLGWNPGRMDVYEDKDIQKMNPAMAGLKSIFVNAVPRPTVPYYSQISQILQKNINAAIADKATVEQALKNTQQEVGKVIEEYGN